MQSEIIQEHFEQIRVDTGSTITNLPDDILFRYYNRARTSVAKKLRSTGDNYFYNEWVSNLTQGQSEYHLPVYRQYTTEGAKTVRVPKCKSVRGVSILKNGGEYVSLNRIEKDTTATLETEREAGYAVMDNSLFIYPTPEKDVTDGLKIIGTYELYRVSEHSTDEEIGIDEEFYEILLAEVKQLIYEYRKMWNERNVMIADIARMWTEWRADAKRTEGVLYIQEPNYSGL